jgi:drug/metabolite transporter (DMT)-like permease
MTLKISQIVGLSSFSLILATGQLLFKAVALKTPQISKIGHLSSLLYNSLFWLAILLYGFATILWIYLLQQVPLSRAYPFAALGFVIVPIGAAVFFGDKITIPYIVGSFLIVTGIYLSAMASQ